MTRHTPIALACMVALAGPAIAADPVPRPEGESDAMSLELTRPPKLPPFDPALIERIRAALAAVDASGADNTPGGGVNE
ncbi:MAG: hypothetical protein AAFQ60_00430 [Pseudomonadota bacterium]